MNSTLRNLTCLATVLAMGLGLASCNENEKPQSNVPVRQSRSLLSDLQGGQVTYSNAPGVPGTPGPMSNPGARGLPGADLTPVTAERSATPQEAPINIPKDARWSLYCASVGGPDRIARMTQLKAYLMANTPFKEWYVVHNEQESTLFYGFYATVERGENPRAAARAHADRKAISEWKDQTGDMPFRACFFTPITPPNPVAPAEWNLENAPPDAYWSVQIMAFKDNPLRKQAAVDAVRDLRGKGIEAYYHHGPTISAVCIGSWPRQAVKEQDVDSGRATNEDDAVLVSNVPLPSRYKNARMQTRDGHRLVAFAQRIELNDPSLEATFRQYPNHAVNYEYLSRKVKATDGTMHDVPSPSFLVIIPRAEPSALSGNGLQNLGNGTDSGGAAPATPWRAGDTNVPAGAGRLRGLGN